MKDKLDGKIMKEFLGLRAKTYSYLIDDSSDDKKSKRHQKACHKKKKQLKFEDYKNCVEAIQLENKINHLEKRQN